MLGPLLALACAPEAEEPVDPGVPVDPLYVPDVSGLDLEAAWAEAFTLALSATITPLWSGHVSTLGLATDGCPDLWAAPPEDTLEVDEGGLAWADHCETGSLRFAGATWWDSAVAIDGDATEELGSTTTASRSLVADAVVDQDREARFAFDGEASDSLTRSDAPDYEHWTWSSLVQGTATGSDAFAASPTPGGWRADQYVYVEGGDTARLEARGNLYLFEDRIQDRWDSVAMDLTLVGEAGAGPGDCTAEPTGWLSVRDTNAYWYDVVFLASEGDTVDTSVDTSCDGCGTLYIRGVESGTVCPDLSAAWDGRLDPPDVTAYVLSIHDLP